MSDKHSSLHAQAKKNQPELEFERHEAVVSGIMSTREFSALELSEQMGKVGHSGHILLPWCQASLPALLLCVACRHLCHAEAPAAHVLMLCSLPTLLQGKSALLACRQWRGWGSAT